MKKRDWISAILIFLVIVIGVSVILTIIVPHRDKPLPHSLYCLDTNFEIANANWIEPTSTLSYIVLRRDGGPEEAATIVHVIDRAIRTQTTGKPTLSSFEQERYTFTMPTGSAKPTKIEIAASFEIEGRTKTCEIAGETRDISTIN